MLTVLHCSSLVKNNLHVLQETLQNAVRNDACFKPTKQLLLTMAEDIEALDSIYQCGLAQERISNDVLSLGKMQLDLLDMFNIGTDIRMVAQKVVSIFQNEARMNRIFLNLTISPLFDTLGLTTLMTDPARFTQMCVWPVICMELTV